MIIHLLYCTSHVQWELAAELFTSCQCSCILFKNRTDIVLNGDRSCSGAGGNLRKFSLEDQCRGWQSLKQSGLLHNIKIQIL